MTMQPGESWRCSNAECSSEITVSTGSPLEGANPRCSCGAPMKKKYNSPVFRYLDFLRAEEPALAAAGDNRRASRETGRADAA